MSQNLNDLSVAQLKTLFSELSQDGTKPQKKKDQLVAQIEALQAAQREKAAPPAQSQDGARRRKRFDRPASPDGTKAHRPGTKRAWVVETLSTVGATYDEVMAHCGWDVRTAYEGITLIHKLLGWGLREDQNGRIFAFRNETAA